MVKKTSVKKTVAKKTATRVQPVMENEHKCGCGHECHCGCHCGFWRFIRNLLILLIVFVLGAMSARFFMKVHHMPMPHVDFDDNGCVVVDSIKCPKMLEKLQSADMDSDGCITKQEFKKSMFKKHKMKRNMPHDAETPDVENRIVVETESVRVIEKTNM